MGVGGGAGVEGVFALKDCEESLTDGEVEGTSPVAIPTPKCVRVSLTAAQNHIAFFSRHLVYMGGNVEHI